MHISQCPKGWESNPNYVYCGRAKKGQPQNVLGNPIARGYPCMMCGGTHTDAGSTIPCYRLWLARMLKREWGIATQPSPLANAILGLRGKHLVCFCYDTAKCHTLVLAQYAATPYVAILNDGDVEDIPAGIYPCQHHATTDEVTIRYHSGIKTLPSSKGVTILKLENLR